MSGISKRDLPNKSTPCIKVLCVYNVDGLCDEPRINKGNSDALCHKMTNKHLLELLKNSIECFEG